MMTDKRADPFYTSPAWRTLRIQILERDRFRCVVCGVSVARKGLARVDHIIPRSAGGSPLDPSNLRTLCADHDNQSHREKGRGGGERDERFVIRGCDIDGMPIDPNHHWR